MAKRRSVYAELARVVTRMTPAERQAFRAVATRPIATILYVQGKAKRHENYRPGELPALLREVRESMEPFLAFLATYGIDLVSTTPTRTRRTRPAGRPQ